MVSGFFDWFWHEQLKRPYRLRVGIDQHPECQDAVVLLHGIGSSSAVWQYVATTLDGTACHVLAFDLLGFGDSPKPLWLEYSADDHARAVIAAIERQRHRKQPVILAGHSMGCLIAVRIAALRPDLVRGLILYQPPLYVDLPVGRRYSVRRDLYYRLYTHLLNNPNISSSRLQRMVMKRTGLLLAPETLQPFFRSLKSTIMQQTTLKDMRKLRAPMDVIYGSLDMVVIRGRSRAVFNGITAPLQTHTLAEFHGISKRASRFIAKRVQLILEETA
jgi:pimeloyl-ACP methyl ester carboxylesterase